VACKLWFRRDISFFGSEQRSRVRRTP